MENLVETKALNLIRDTRQQAKERKGSAQRIGGASSTYVLSESSGQFDWSGLVNGPSGNPTYGINQFIITLTSSTAENPLVDLSLVGYYASSGSNWVEYTYERSEDDAWSFTAPELNFIFEELPGLANEPFKVRYRAAIVGRVNTSAAFKLQAVGTDAVTIEVARVS